MTLTKVRYSMISEQYANVTDFGASPSASASVNDAAFTAALAAATVVFVPAGTYAISSTITLNNKKIIGETANTTTLQPTSAVTTSAVILDSNSFLECIGIDGTNTTGVIGVNAGGNFAFPVNMNDVLIENFTGSGGIGLQIRDVVGGVFNFVRAKDNETSLRSAGSTGSFPTYCSFNDCYFERATVGVKLERANGFTFNNCLFELCTEEGFLIEPIDIVSRVTLNNCWFERNYQSSASNYQLVVEGLGTTAQYIAVKDCFFYEGNVAKTAKFSNAKHVTFTRNQIQNVAGTVRFENISTGTVAEQNRALTSAFDDANGFIHFDAIIEDIVSADTATATTIYTMARPGRYDITAYLANSGSAGNNTAFATAIWDGSNGRIDSNNGALMTLTLSGANIQVTQSTGSTQNVTVKASQIL